MENLMGCKQCSGARRDFTMCTCFKKARRKTDRHNGCCSCCDLPSPQVSQPLSDGAALCISCVCMQLGQDALKSVAQNSPLCRCAGPK